MDLGLNRGDIKYHHCSLRLVRGDMKPSTYRLILYLIQYFENHLRANKMTPWYNPYIFGLYHDKLFTEKARGLASRGINI